MSKTRLTVFLCRGKDCRKAWSRVTDHPPARWLKRQVERAGLPCKLNVVETSCQDGCARAACLCAVCGPCAAPVDSLRSGHDADRVLAALRSCAERAADTPADAAREKAAPPTRLQGATDP
jgi:hypothetical protein